MSKKVNAALAIIFATSQTACVSTSDGQQALGAVKNTLKGAQTSINEATNYEVTQDPVTGLKYSEKYNLLVPTDATEGTQHCAQSAVLRDKTKGAIKKLIETTHEANKDGDVSIINSGFIKKDEFLLNRTSSKFEAATQRCVQSQAYAAGNCTVSAEGAIVIEDKPVSSAYECANTNEALRLDEIKAGAYKEGGKRYNQVKQSITFDIK